MRSHPVVIGRHHTPIASLQQSGHDHRPAPAEDEQGKPVSDGWTSDPWSTKILWRADHSGNTHTNAKTYHYIHSDHLSTPQIATDKNGHQTWAQVSEAFGKARLWEGTCRVIPLG